MVAIEIGVGLVLLLGGGEFLVRGAVTVAGRLGVSPLLIGLTLVGFGTSMPELVASLRASMIGAPGVAVGNVVGSNIANILLILGVAALLRPIVTTAAAFRRDGSMMVLATVLLALVLWPGEMGRIAGGIFVALLLGFTGWSYVSERRGGGPSATLHEAEAEELAEPAAPMWRGILEVLGGIAAVVWGADLLVTGAVEIARGVGISDAVIGVTLVAVGTSLPELATSVIASLRGHGDVAFGNVVGSNIFNALGIMGVTALVAPVPVAQEILDYDLWVMLAATALLIVFASTGRRVSRWEGAIFSAAYAGYIGYRFL